MKEKFDIAIIGGGAVGLACAVQLKSAVPNLTICIIEKEADTAFGTSGRNSAVVHAGFNNPTGSLKAQLCLEGSLDFENLASALGIEYHKTGKVVVGFSDEDRKALEKLLLQGKANGVEELRIIEKAELTSISPNIEGNFGLYSPNTAIFNPFKYCTALAKAATKMGVVPYFSSKVEKIENNDENSQNWKLTAEKTFISNNHTYEKQTLSIVSRVVINAAGLNAGKLSHLAGAGNYETKPCRGEYHILEKKAAGLIKMPVYPIPNEGKNVLGIHLTPTTDGKVMFGPSAEFIDQTDDYATTADVMKMLREDGSFLCPDLKTIPAIRSFSGIRPKCNANGGDFIIEESLPGFINLIGIESPGMTASMPIGRKVAKMVFFSSNINFSATDGRVLLEHSKGIPDTSYINKLISEAAHSSKGLPYNPNGEAEFNTVLPNEPNSEAQLSIELPHDPNGEDKYGCTKRLSAHGISDPTTTQPSTVSGTDHRLICRCEGVTAAAILEAFDEICETGALPTIKGIKNRTGAFMGLCQGGFCTVDTAELLEKERNFHPSLLTYDGPGSEMFDRHTRLK